MTVSDAALSLGISPALVYKLCDRGKLGHYRIGFGRGRIDISPEQLDAYRRACRVEPVADRQDDGTRRPRTLGGVRDRVAEVQRRRGRARG